jgi:hypothetical protein
LFGRTWQVNLESEAAKRRDVSDLWNVYVRNAKGTWCRYNRSLPFAS